MCNAIGFNDDSCVSQKNAMYILYCPLVGLVVSIFLTCFFIFRFKPWSFFTMLYTLIPFFLSAIGCLILTLFQRYKYKNTGGHCKKSYKLILPSLIILLITLNVVLWASKSVKYINVTLTQLVEMEQNNIMNTKSYYVIYSTKRCMFCKQMVSTYKETFLKNKDKKVYMVDISDEITNGKLIEEKGIDKIPVLIHYKKGTEINRIEGVATVDSLNLFVNQ